ncbi:MAG: LLM class flavin-dependent oxidoreductase [Candidatus Limnocylindria bacterium]
MNRGALRHGFGITSHPRRGLDRLAARIEELGYEELWSNDTSAGSGLSTLAPCAPSTQRLVLAVGVIGLSSRDPDSIAAEAVRLGLPLDRLVVGIGSGSSSSTELVRRGGQVVRRTLPGVPVAVAAVGPRMCRLAGEIADIVLLNWATPDRIAWSRARVAEGAASADRRTPTVAAYVRVAIGPDAEARLEREGERYRGSSPAYRAAFDARRGGVGIAERSADGVADALRPYRAALDTVIVRAMPAADDVDAWLEIAEAGAPPRR